MKLGKIHIYCGDGKGKTTTAIGLMVRCLGAGKKILFYQFMKNNTSSERVILEQLEGMTCLQGKENAKFSFQMTEQEKQEERKENDNRLLEIFQEAKEYDLLCLDEVLYTIRAGLLDEKLLVKCLQEKKEELEVILTGRDPSETLCELADYVSEIQKKKHPFDQGLGSRLGIEY